MEFSLPVKRGLAENSPTRRLSPMPIHLPPISRRRFLGQTLAATAALLAAGTLEATTRKRRRHTWALLSDTHIAADRKTIAHDINMTDNLLAISSEIRASTELPEHLLIAGDCAYNRGQIEDYQTFVELLKPLRTDGIPIHLALGNHDHREHFLKIVKPPRPARRSPGDHYVTLIESERANWFLLDSLEKTLSTPGLLGEQQLKWLAETLDRHPTKPALIVVHHNPVTGQVQAALKDTDALFAVLAPRKQVKAYFFGHTHRWNLSRHESGIHLVNLPTTAYVPDKTRATGWVQASLETEGITLELRCLEKNHPEHGRKTDLQWRA
jgi:3',5'-cyclic-AMP phosphodiesterase